jgi:hypothetical protein
MANYLKSLCKNTAVSKGKAALHKQADIFRHERWLEKGFLVPPPEIRRDRTNVYLLDLATRSNSSFFLIA